eukprot:gene990-1938_t
MSTRSAKSVSEMDRINAVKASSEKERLISGKNAPNVYAKPVVIEPKEEIKEDKGAVLIVAFILMLIFQLGNRIFGKLETYPMYNYPMFLNLMSTVLYIPICFAYIIPVQMFTKIITKDQMEIPKMKFGVMGLLDSIAGIMQVFAVNYISNAPMIVLVQQSAIPISMLISKTFLKARYTTAQYVGAGIVLCGIVVVLIPNFFASSSQNSTDASKSLSEIFWVTILISSCIPMCMSSVYKEKALGEVDIDVVYLNGWVSVFQSIFAIPLCFPSASIINMPYDQLLPNMYGGMLCWAGINTITGEDGLNPPDDCAMGPIFVTTFLCFNVAYNLLIIVVLKHGSANILWMASTVIVPLSNVAFSLKIMPGHRPLHTVDLLGLGVIMFGLVVYRFTAQIRSLIHHLNDKISDEELEAEKEARIIGIKAERKQTNYLGLNQIEALQTLVDSRVTKAQKSQLFRSPQQIRGNLLLRLGIPPSPYVSLGPKGRYKDIQRSPAGTIRKNVVVQVQQPILVEPVLIKKMSLE